MKKIFIFLLVFITGITNVYAADTYTSVLSSVLEDTPSPAVSSIGGEWAVISLARSGKAIDNEYYNEYYNRALEFVECGEVRRYTDYSRLILAISAIGKDTMGIEAKLSDFDKVVSQGINGAIYALIALDSKNYECGIRSDYLNYILSHQLSDGGWSLAGDISDVDVTAMALQALSNYRNLSEVETAINCALGFLNGSEITSSESAAQCIIALCSLNIDPKGYVNELMKYYSDGRFLHIRDGVADAMATEQGALSLTAYERYKNGENALYNMGDVKSGGDIVSCRFLDVDPKDAAAVSRLFEHSIINGKTDYLFAPDDNLTRAQAAAIIVRTMAYTEELKMPSGNYFTDVKNDDWFRIYVNTAAEYGLVNGVGDGKFRPEAVVSAEQLNLMLDRFCAYSGREAAVNADTASRIDAARAIDTILWKN